MSRKPEPRRRKLVPSRGDCSPRVPCWTLVAALTVALLGTLGAGRGGREFQLRVLSQGLG